MRFVLVFLLAAAMPAQALADSFSISSKDRVAGLIRNIYTLPHPINLDKSLLMVELKGRLKRAQCSAMQVKEFDNATLEILKLAISLNKPVSIMFSYQASEPDNNCLIEKIELKIS